MVTMVRDGGDDRRREFEVKTKYKVEETW